MSTRPRLQDEIATTHLTFPNESVEYRKARTALLAEEMALRRQSEVVAARRRALPPGGEVPKKFECLGEGGIPEKIEMSKLFGRHRTLILYSFMYGPERDAPCPMCSQLLDSVNGGGQSTSPSVQRCMSWRSRRSRA